MNDFETMEGAPTVEQALAYFIAEVEKAGLFMIHNAHRTGPVKLTFSANGAAVKLSADGCFSKEIHSLVLFHDWFKFFPSQQSIESAKKVLKNVMRSVKKGAVEAIHSSSIIKRK